MQLRPKCAKIGSRFRGGIAQLVERQLCKLEVRGSNPLASIFNFRLQIVDLRFTESDTKARDEDKSSIGNHKS